MGRWARLLHTVLQASWARRALVFAFVLGLFPAGLLASGLVGAHAAPAAEVTLRLWPAGQGRVEVVQGGTGLDPDPCGFTKVLERGSAVACEVQVTVGSPVTLRAVPEPTATVPPQATDDMPDFPVMAPAFVRWSRFDCGTATSCTFTPTAESDGDWITALFTPLQLQVGVFGVGGLTFRRSDGGVVQPLCPASVGFGDRTCHAAFPADIQVTIETSVAPTGWGIGCEPEGGSQTSSRCTLGMSNLRTLAFVSFDSQQQPLDPPFRLSPRVTVRRAGSGQGRVSGSGLNCPPTCEAFFDYQARVRLRAEETSGSTFVRWEGICGTDRSCAFDAGSATQVQARFDTAPGTTTTASTTLASTSTSTTTRATTTTTTTAPTTTRPGPRLGGVSVQGRGARRRVVFTITVDRAGRATARLIRQRRVVGWATSSLARGRNRRSVPVPRGAARGKYLLSVRVVAGGRATVLTARVTLPA